MTQAHAGLPVSENLRVAFSDLHKNGSGRFIVAKVNGEVDISLVKVEKGTDNWRSDLDMIPPLIGHGHEPAFILFRTNETNELGFRWILFSYVPERSKVHQKLVHASSRVSIKQNLGSMLFFADILGNIPEELSRKGFETWEKVKAAPNPATEAEEIQAQAEFKNVLDANAIAHCTSPSMFRGSGFECEPQVQDALKDLVSGGQNYVHITLVLDKENFALVKRDNIAPMNIHQQIPINHSGFHFYRFDHEHQGKKESPIIFIFNCPDGSGGTKACHVRERMMFSSAKEAAEKLLEQFAAHSTMKLEVNGPSDIDADAILVKLHPVPLSAQEKAIFGKPKPAGKGPKRLIRSKLH
eukprot:TRINITY_DN17503_c0_g1_i1.p1 TRINITY_DN17503_c0_g1~~TRINITY_DN17503_c0_g1_i1.p1  ORF type:complete len:354 (-),score=100.59 TRINITY_DN17503_c0_g1_i1:61-1122(-)